MKAFFEKIKVKSIYHCLKYNEPIKNSSNWYVDFNYINPKYYNRLNDILVKVTTFYIMGCDLKKLPNNIKNVELFLVVIYYDEHHIFPENWVIRSIYFKFPRYMENQNKDKIPKSFKTLA